MSFIADYFISKFLIVFEYRKKILKNLSKLIMRYEYTDSWGKCNKTLPPKEFFLVS